ncbi:MAG: hypothetical protein EVB11_05445 [Winogradskyella sp.]|nr:MAG: hypothetical protein EVB11_05445 [Winogradskyella sp.]
MNEFEKYIKSQKEAIDTEDFSLEIWSRIEKELPKKRKTKVIPLWWASAAAAVALFAVVLINFETNKALSPAEYLSKNGINSSKFEAQLNEKTALIKKLEVPVGQKSDFETILSQLKTLDQEYLEYLEHIEQNGYQERIGEHILEYYKTKIMLLDKIQKQVKEINYYETKYNKQSKTEPLFL